MHVVMYQYMYIVTLLLCTVISNLLSINVSKNENRIEYYFKAEQKILFIEYGFYVFKGFAHIL